MKEGRREIEREQRMEERKSELGARKKDNQGKGGLDKRRMEEERAKERK